MNRGWKRVAHSAPPGGTIEGGFSTEVATLVLKPLRLLRALHVNRDSRILGIPTISFQ